MKWFLLLIGVVVVAVGVSVALVVTGDAAQCPQTVASAPVKSQKEIGDTLARDKRVTITDADATASGRGLLGSTLTDPRVCFDSQGGHISGKFKLDAVSPSVYVTVAATDIDLSGTSPKVSKLDIRIGGLPNIPGISDMAATQIAGVVNQGLAQIRLSRPLKAQFSAGAATVSE